MSDSGGNAVGAGKQVFFATADAQISKTGNTGSFVYGFTDLNTGPTTDANGRITLYVKVDENPLHTTWIIQATNYDPGAFEEFYLPITDVLYFSGTSTTRSIAVGIAADTNIGAPVSATHWANADSDTTNDVTLTYSLEGTDAGSFNIVPGTGQLKTKTGVTYNAGATYSVTVKVTTPALARSSGANVPSSATRDVTISVTGGSTPPPNNPPNNNPPVPGDSVSLQVKLVANGDQRTANAILTWNPPNNEEADGYEYRYRVNPWTPWKSTGSSNTRYTVTGLDIRKEYTFQIRAFSDSGGTRRYIYTSPASSPSNSEAIALQRRKRRIFECPVGWVRSDGFAGRNRRALLYEVKLEMDIRDPVSIYKPAWVAIYVHPDEGLETLDGWKLQVALPYNRHREYLLTAENSVIVDAGFVEGGFAFIVPPEADLFPMTGMGFPGSPSPGFDYRLYDDQGRRVDFGISCYKRFDIFQVLKDAEDPRVLRQVHLESFDWNTHYLRSEWTVPTPVPAAPSQVKKNMVGTWADLKKRKIE